MFIFILLAFVFICDYYFINVGNSRLFREKGVMVLTRIAWAAITISLNKGYSYDLRLRMWHCSSTLRVL